MTFSLCCCGTEAPTHATPGRATSRGRRAAGRGHPRGLHSPLPPPPHPRRPHAQHCRGSNTHTSRPRLHFPALTTEEGTGTVMLTRPPAGVTSTSVQRGRQHRPHHHAHTRPHTPPRNGRLINTGQRFAAEERQKYEAGALRGRARRTAERATRPPASTAVQATLPPPPHRQPTQPARPPPPHAAHRRPDTCAAAGLAHGSAGSHGRGLA